MQHNKKTNENEKSSLEKMENVPNFTSPQSSFLFPSGFPEKKYPNKQTKSNGTFSNYEKFNK